VSTQRVEFRVRWRREGQAQISTRIYQTWSSAYRKAQAIAAIEAVKDDTTFESMPSLAEGPVIEVREVGEWRANEFQPHPPDDRLLDRMRERYARAPHDRSTWEMPF
jgi:hypothetical protein